MTDRRWLRYAVRCIGGAGESTWPTLAPGFRFLLLDEMRNIFAGPFREQRIVLNKLRSRSNELQVSLVCFGVNEACEAISGDVQRPRRLEVFPLTRWSVDGDFGDLVLAIVGRLAVRNPMVLSARAMRRALQLTNGGTPNVWRFSIRLRLRRRRVGQKD